MLETFESTSAAERLHAAVAFVVGVPAATELVIIGALRDAADDLARRVTAARRSDLRATPREPHAPCGAADRRLGVAPAKNPALLHAGECPHQRYPIARVPAGQPLVRRADSTVDYLGLTGR